jgi:hypothetical protein
MNAIKFIKRKLYERKFYRVVDLFFQLTEEDQKSIVFLADFTQIQEVMKERTLIEYLSDLADLEGIDL